MAIAGQDKSARVLQFRIGTKLDFPVGGERGECVAMAFSTGSLLAWERELSMLKERVAHVLGRRELKETCSGFLDGLLSGTERKPAG